MAKVNLSDVGYIPSAANTINTNNQRIVDAIENTLSRDGTSPNEMNAPLDMNNERIYNLPEPQSDTEPARKKDIDDLIAAASSSIIATQIEAITGVDNKKVMSPLRTKQVLDSRLASQNEAEIGVDNTKTMTPLRAKQSIVANAKDGAWTQTGTGAVARTISQKLRERPTLFDFIPPSLHAGITAGSETTDVTAYLQAAAAEASAKNETLVGNPGKFFVSGTTSFNSTAADEEFGRIAFDGAGMAQTVFVSTVSGTTPVFDITNTWGTNEQARVKFQNFSIIRSTKNQTGRGISLTNVSYIDFENVAIAGFSIGLIGVDALGVTLKNMIVTQNTFGVRGLRFAHTHPNGWTLDKCVINGNKEIGVFFDKPAALMLDACHLEGNGVGGSGGIRGGVYINANPAEGATGLVVKGGYFEGSAGTADILIDANDGDRAVHSIDGATFNRISGTTFVTNNIAAMQGGAGPTLIRVKGCGFRGFDPGNGDPYVPSTSRKYIDAASAPVGILRWDIGGPQGGNHYDSSLEVPTVGGAWDDGVFSIGAYRLWVDSTGDLRIKNGAPSSDTDGTVVGTQS